MCLDDLHERVEPPPELVDNLNFLKFWEDYDSVLGHIGILSALGVHVPPTRWQWLRRELHCLSWTDSPKKKPPWKEKTGRKIRPVPLS